MTNRLRALACIAVVAGLGVLTACGGGSSHHADKGAAALSNAAAAARSLAAGGASTHASTTGGSTTPIDPCKKLTKADVQPFFTVPIVTQLPTAFNSALTKGCEWATSSGGAIATSLDVVVRVGDDASQAWTMATSGPVIRFSGVGDAAEHVSGDSAFVSEKDGVVCAITTLGRTQLAPLASLTYNGNAELSDSDATAAAQQFGTLCNKIYGSGNTSPTATAAAPTGNSSTSASPNVSIPAISGTMPGTNFPLPDGVDCTGKVTVKDGDTSCSVSIDTSQGAGIYAFYLQQLPKQNYVISHMQSTPTANGTVALILFSGNGYVGTSDINLVGTTLTIDLYSS